MRAIIAVETAGALLAARQSFHCQFSVRARRPDSWRATSSRPIINSTVRELDYKLGRSSARPQIGRRDFPEDLDYDCTLRALRFPRYIGERADQCAANRVASSIYQA